MKFSQRSYGQPTPKNLRRLGDGLLGIATTITGSAIFADQKWLALTALIIGVSGKFLTNFFAE